MISSRIQLEILAIAGEIRLSSTGSSPNFDIPIFTASHRSLNFDEEGFVRRSAGFILVGIFAMKASWLSNSDRDHEARKLLCRVRDMLLRIARVYALELSPWIIAGSTSRRWKHRNSMSAWIRYIDCFAVATIACSSASAELRAGNPDCRFELQDISIPRFAGSWKGSTVSRIGFA